MKKIFVTILIAFVASTWLSGQIGPIDSQKVGISYKFTHQGNILTMNDLVNILRSDAEAYPVIKKAKANNTLGSVFGGVGGFCVGWPLGTAIAGGEPEWGMLAIGGVCVAIGIPLSISAGKKANEAVSIYNSNLQESYRPAPIDIRFGAGDYGLGFVMKF